MESLVSILRASPPTRVPLAQLAETCERLHDMLGGDENRETDDDARRLAGSMGLGPCLVAQLRRCALQGEGETPTTPSNSTSNSTPPTTTTTEIAATLSCVRLIRQLARDRTQLDSLVADGAGDAVLDAMRVFPDTPVQLEGMHALLNLASTAPNQASLCQSGAHVVVSTSTLAANATSADDAPTLARVACDVLARLGLSPATKPIVVLEAPPGTGPVDAIVDALRVHGNLSSVTEKAFAAVAVLAGDDATANALAARNDLLSLLVQRAQTHARDAIVQEWLCRAVTALARSPQRRDDLFAGGFPQAVGEGMRTHAVAHPGVAAFGCAAIRALGHHSPTRKLSLLRSANAALAVVSALKSHPNHAFVAFHGCSAVWGLTGEPECKAALLKLNADAAIVAALRGNADSAAVATQALAALWSLANHASVGRAQVMRSNAPSAIVDAMRRFTPLNPHVASHGAAALWSLAAAPANRSTLLRAGAGVAVVEALLLHCSHRDVAIKCLGCLECLCVTASSEEATQLANRDNAVHVLVVALKRHENDTRIATLVLGVLADVAAKVQDKAAFHAERVEALAMSFSNKGAMRVANAAVVGAAVGGIAPISPSSASLASASASATAAAQSVGNASGGAGDKPPPVTVEEEAERLLDALNS